MDSHQAATCGASLIHPRGQRRSSLATADASERLSLCVDHCVVSEVEWSVSSVDKRLNGGGRGAGGRLCSLSPGQVTFCAASNKLAD